MIIVTFWLKFFTMTMSIFLDSKISNIAVVVSFILAESSFYKRIYLVFRVFTVRVTMFKIIAQVRNSHLSKANKLRN